MWMQLGDAALLDDADGLWDVHIREGLYTLGKYAEFRRGDV